MAKTLGITEQAVKENYTEAEVIERLLFETHEKFMITKASESK